MIVEGAEGIQVRPIWREGAGGKAISDSEYETLMKSSMGGLKC